MTISDKELEQINAQIEDARLKQMQSENQYTQQANDNASDEKSIIKEQLDLGEELDRIDYLLRGFTLERDPKTKVQNWVKPKDNDLIVLSDYGVHLIRNTIAWYLNKNTLLSNYDDETIRNKMEDFSSDLNDTIFMEYEKVFQYPTMEDCKALLRERLEKKKELKMFALELLGKKVSKEEEKEIEDKILKEIEPIIGKELEKIKEQKIKNKLKRFLIIMREIQDAIHSTYLRAWKGQERTTLRQHIHISENKGGIQLQPQNNGGPFAWLRRR